MLLPFLNYGLLTIFDECRDRVVVYAMSEVRFIDRVEEIRALRGWCSSFRYVPLYLYGPEGCGKTRLLRELVKRFDELMGGDSIAIYVDALEGRDIGRALMTSGVLAKSVDIAKLGLRVVSDLIARNIPVGQALSQSLSLIVDEVARRVYGRVLHDKYVLIVVDDVTRAVGLDKIEWYVKWVFELMNKLQEEYRPRAINVIVSTSEGLSLDLISRHRHASIKLLWNLSREAFKELFTELKPPQNLDFEEVWRLLGGNPGKLVELATWHQWSLNRMIEEYRVRLFKHLSEVKERGLINELKILVDDITEAEEVHSREMRNLIRLLEEKNLVIYKYWTTLTGKEFKKPNPELGIGRYYAWQTPLYREILREIVSQALS